MNKRYSTLTFPAYAFLPGVHPHPNRAGGYREGVTDPVVGKISESSPAANEAFCFSIDLFNHEFFWESHIYLEALWNAHDRRGRTADFLKGMIKLAAAGVKFKTSDLEPARVHLESAREYFLKVRSTVPASTPVLGISIDQILVEIENCLKNPEKLFAIHLKS